MLGGEEGFAVGEEHRQRDMFVACRGRDALLGPFVERIGDEGAVFPQRMASSGSHRRGNRSVEIEMDAALFLVETAPPSGTRILALGNNRGAGCAADRFVALSEQRMLGQAVVDLVLVDVDVGEIG
ncbi:hypothetical protein D3C87_1677590 [compost metagenome]